MIPAESVAASALPIWDCPILVVDDVPLGGAFNPALTSLNLHDVDRIEVVRGATPVTYGATSFVGVIHVVHASGAVREGRASFTAGSFGSGGGSIDVSLPSAGQWQSRASISLDRQGYTDDRTSIRRGQGTGTPTIILGNDGGLNITSDNGATLSSNKNRGLATFLLHDHR